MSRKKQTSRGIDPKSYKWKSDLRIHSKNLKIILYIGAGLLVANTLRAATLLNWSLDYVDASLFVNLPMEKLAFLGMHKLVLVIVAARGILYSFILLALYLPAAAILRKEAEKKAVEDKLSREIRKSWLSALMAISPTDKIKAANQMAFDAGRNLQDNI